MKCDRESDIDTYLWRISILDDDFKGISTLRFEDKVAERRRQRANPIPQLVRSEITVRIHERSGFSRPVYTEQVDARLNEAITKIVRERCSSIADGVKACESIDSLCSFCQKLWISDE